MLASDWSNLLSQHAVGPSAFYLPQLAQTGLVGKPQSAMLKWASRWRLNHCLTRLSVS
jgi:hypothetical protein